MKKRVTIPGVDQKLLIKDAAKLLPDPSRRLFLRGAASLGALTFLTGCDIVDEDSAEKFLRYVSTFNDRVQAAIFQPQKLAPVYPESMVTKPFPFNAYYSEDEAPEVDGDTYKLEVAGLVENKKSWTCPNSTRCRRSARSRATSASKAGAPLATGPAPGSRISSSASART
jgi:DMSO/TMAO reductase YedYZ molybdopterin-dependent catalytic subunit